jgi:hypothetical protein
MHIKGPTVIILNPFNESESYITIPEGQELEIPNSEPIAIITDIDKEKGIVTFSSYPPSFKIPLRNS